MESVEVSLFQNLLTERKERLQSAIARVPDADQIAALLREVDAALERVHGGSFGMCETCHDPIEADRLLADPLIRVCLDHLTTSERRHLEDDLEMAHQIQNGLLPGRNAAPAGWEYHYHYEPAGPVSGDYCDIVQRGPASSMLFLTGDVAGKGVAASLLMSQLHAIFRSLAPSGSPLAQILDNANRLFCESTLSSHFATLAAAEVRSGGEVTIASAGHCPPILLGEGGISTVAPTGLPLGLFCSSSYSQITLQLHPNDSLIFYTDGLSEAGGPEGEPYGEERIHAVLRPLHRVSAESATQAILSDWRQYRAGIPKSDDMTLMIIRRLN